MLALICSSDTMDTDHIAMEIHSDLLSAWARGRYDRIADEFQDKGDPSRVARKKAWAQLILELSDFAGVTKSEAKALLKKARRSGDV